MVAAEIMDPPSNELNTVPRLDEVEIVFAIERNVTPWPRACVELILGKFPVINVSPTYNFFLTPIPPAIVTPPPFCEEVASVEMATPSPPTILTAPVVLEVLGVVELKIVDGFTRKFPDELNSMLVASYLILLAASHAK